MTILLRGHVACVRLPAFLLALGCFERAPPRWLPPPSNRTTLAPRRHSTHGRVPCLDVLSSPHRLRGVPVFGRLM